MSDANETDDTDDTVTPHRGEVLQALTRELAGLARLPGHVRRVAMRADGVSVEVEWAGEAAAAPTPADEPTPAAVRSPAAPDDEHLVIRAPLVGTFYAAPQPGSPPFVVPGDAVEKGQTLAIVEAMKLMNHVEADCVGRVVEVLVHDGQPVEFDQPLLLLAATADGAS
jgi:acetyl-CoA carboxylase biotin carboxyl carrier protein